MERATPTVVKPRRRSRRRPEDLSSDLLDAAAVEFAAHGFDGASTRRIAERAGAHQPQINYHFSSKEHLWRATVDRLFELMDAPASLEASEGDPVADLSQAIRQFIAFSAAHPELNRIINLEATASSPRLDWLVDTYLRPIFAVVATIWTELRHSGHGADLTPGEVWEVITSYGALHFANEPMLSMLGVYVSGGKPESDLHADRVLALLFPESRRAP